MTTSSRYIAEQATLRAFLNCYLREVEPGIDCTHVVGSESGEPATIEAIELPLTSHQATLRAELSYRSLTGCHVFGRLWLCRTREDGWQPVEPFSAVLMLVHEIYRVFCRGHAEQLRERELELLHRLTDSYRLMAAYVEARRRHREMDTFITAEQAVLFGHWLHPTPKSRQGMTDWQQRVYAPELGGCFALHYFAADASLVRHGSSRPQQAPDMIKALLGDDAQRLARTDGKLLLPMHPLQAQALLLDPAVNALLADGRLSYLGPAGPEFAATSSVRTLYHPALPWMVKFSIPVRITNSLRRNRRHELEAGGMMDRLLARTGFLRRYPAFRMIQDPAYITLDLPGREESGFEVILRDNPFTGGKERGVCTIAALTADPLPGAPSRLAALLKDLAQRDGQSPEAAGRQWFERYLDCALEPLLRLFDEQGIALEAHQQNSLLDVSTGYPTAYYYRDNQGYYLSERYRGQLDRLAPEAAQIASLYYPDDTIQDRFAYYLIVNQVYAIISRMGQDGLVSEAALLAMLYRRLERLAGTLEGAGRDFARSLLHRSTIPAKGNLLTRLYDVDELEADNEQAIYTELVNPLWQWRQRQRQEVADAVA
ncbi:IucA/IucC family protein [Oceanimonas sp. CHS3-5]|uniref:IucA/IucC family protein n=1 Tax=Oceanimonas sp. CHS3-5 TaxID=3068186 RepID=UPI00273F5D9E|nr:IucA/IucC family protein [Oceanimonas sp. CHS3-5]MDP5291797.1 IucA/IucC family protein [Oceanimonas sp. CHS3-5]